MLTMFANTLKLLYLVAIGLEIYLFVCAYSLYKIYMGVFQEDTINEQQPTITGKAHEQPPPYINN